MNRLIVLKNEMLLEEIEAKRTGKRKKAYEELKYKKECRSAHVT
jgi:hypothetical protein